MQTFLPHSSFEHSAEVLDNRRLNKQITECLQLALALAPLDRVRELSDTGLKTVQKRLTDPKYVAPYTNHPCTKMWAGHLFSLWEYSYNCFTEWRSRGYRSHLETYRRMTVLCIKAENVEPPKWLGDPDFHASHRSNLLRKDPAHYSQFGWTEGPELSYIWPK